MTRELLDRQVPAIYEASFNAGRRLRRGGHPRARRRRLPPDRGEVVHQAQGRAPPGRRGPAPRPASERARRRARRADAPQPRVRLPATSRISSSARTSPTRSRRCSPRCRSWSPASCACSRAASPTCRSARTAASRTSARSSAAAGGACRSTTSARSTARPNSGDDLIAQGFETIAELPAEVSRRSRRASARGADRPHGRRAGARRALRRVPAAARVPRLRDRGTGHPGVGRLPPLRPGAGAVQLRSSGRGRDVDAPRMDRGRAPTTRDPSWRGISSRRAAARARSWPTTPASSGAASSASPQRCPSWRTSFSASRPASPTRCRSSASTSITPSSAAASA